MRTIAIAGPHIVAGQLIKYRQMNGTHGRYRTLADNTWVMALMTKCGKETVLPAKVVVTHGTASTNSSVRLLLIMFKM